MLLVQKIIQQPFSSIFNNWNYLRLYNTDLQSRLTASYAQNVDFVIGLFYLNT